jgi:hypothetical protein
MPGTTALRRHSRALLIVLALTAMGIVAAIGIASAAGADRITLYTGDASTPDQFEYGTVTQPIAVGGNACKVADSTLNGPIFTITSTAADNKGAVTTGVVGFVEDGLGVSFKGNGNAQDCGRTDYVTTGAETLTLNLGSAPLADFKAISYVQFDFEAKFDATVVIDFLRSGTVYASSAPVTLSLASDDGPDSKFNDKFTLSCSTAACNKSDAEPAAGDWFTGVRIRPVSGAVALEGGATWEFAPGTSPSAHRTIFFLTEFDPQISIDVKTNGTDASNSTPSDDNDIEVGDTVTWTYTVSNPGNVPLSDVTVTDSGGATPAYVSGDSGNGLLDPSETWVYTATGTAVAGDYTNTGTANAKFNALPITPATDGSGYFGVLTGLTLNSIAPNGTVVPSGEPFTRTFTVTNTGNVPITAVIVDEGGTDVCTQWTFTIGGDTFTSTDIPAGATATCDLLITASGGEQTTSYSIAGTGPFGQVPDPAISSGDITYYGGLDCGESVLADNPGTNDDPYANFWIGPDKDDEPCAVAVVVTSETTGPPESRTQEVSVEPPAGYDWGGVTGVVTIEWDVEAATDDPIARTRQVFTSSPDVIIPWCTVEIPLTLGAQGYELANPEMVYDTATGTGDVCLILQNTTSIDDGGTVFTQTTEAYYVYNDPKFAR